MFLILVILTTPLINFPLTDIEESIAGGGDEPKEEENSLGSDPVSKAASGSPF